MCVCVLYYIYGGNIMKLKDINRRLKSEYKNTVVFMKYGNFYRCFYNDAIVVGYIFNYKLHDDKVGFPISVIDNIEYTLCKYNIDYLIYNNSNNIIYNYFNNNNYNIYLNMGNSKYNIDNYILSISNKVKYILECDINKYIVIKRFLDEL